MITTERFLLRRLVPDDAGERYSAWFNDASVKDTIMAASAPHGVDDLRRYIEVRSQCPDVLFLGIFVRETNEHIGNIKYEPIDRNLHYAVMGVLIGEPRWRGRGVAGEALAASARWLNENLGIKEIVLGVRRDNPRAIRAYEKMGFRIRPTRHISLDSTTSISMVLSL